MAETWVSGVLGAKDLDLPLAASGAHFMPPLYLHKLAARHFAVQACVRTKLVLYKIIYFEHAHPC